MSGEVIEEQEVGEGQAKGMRLPLKAGYGDERVIEVHHDMVIVTILEIIAVERGCTVEELIIIREGEELPLDPGTVIGPGYPHHRRHHVHHKSEVKVVVFYNGDDKHQEFKRHATVEEVLTWAIDVFKIDPTMQTEFELALHGKKDELPGTEHIGHVAGHDSELELDLVRGAFVNGAA